MLVLKVEQEALPVAEVRGFGGAVMMTGEPFAAEPERELAMETTTGFQWVKKLATKLVLEGTGQMEMAMMTTAETLARVLVKVGGGGMEDGVEVMLPTMLKTLPVLEVAEAA